MKRFGMSVFVVPFIFLIIMSTAYRWFWPELIPQEFNLYAWRVLAEEPKLATALINTLMLGGLVAILNLILALPAGKALAHYNFLGKSTIETILLLPILIPSLAVAMGIQLTMIRVGLADNLGGVLIVHLLPTLPYSIRIFRAGFENLGIKWEEQALTLGVAPKIIFLTIWLPLLIPSIRGALFLTFVISLSQFALTALIGGGNVVTLAMLYFPLFSSANRSVLAVFSLLFALLPIIFLFVTELALRFILPVHRRVSEEN